MKLTTKYTYPEEGTANRRLYPAELIRKVFDDPVFTERCQTASIPVITEAGEAIGWASAHLDETMQVTIDAELYNKVYIDTLQKVYESAGIPCGMILGGRGMVEYDPDTDMNIVTNFTPENVLLCSRPALKHETTIEGDER